MNCVELITRTCGELELPWSERVSEEQCLEGGLEIFSAGSNITVPYTR